VPNNQTEEEEAIKLLTFIDTQNIDELDPSLAEGFSLSVETDLPLTV